VAPHRSWTCSICGRHATLGRADETHKRLDLGTETSEADGQAFTVFGSLIRCPNPDCREYHLSVSAHSAAYAYNPHGPDKYDVKGTVGVGRFQFIPSTTAPLSTSVPASVQEDYVEAYLIRGLSPKAAATLARRALQGMIRDFWGVSKANLHLELVAIKDRCDPDLYQAMMDVKKPRQHRRSSRA